MSDVLLCLSTCPDEASATRIADALVEERLAACVNRMPGVQSTFRWRGRICREPECLLLIKTTRANFDALKARLLALHPYELPELIAVEIAAGHAGYLDWVGAVCGKGSESDASPAP
jgi:periplasmic divalent cation tolerance protein